MWNDPQGRIWFKALVSFIIVVIMSTWLGVCLFIKKDFLDFTWTQVVLVLGGLGIVTAQSYFQSKVKNEDSNTVG